MIDLAIDNRVFIKNNMQLLSHWCMVDDFFI